MSLFVDEYLYASAANSYKCHSLLMNIGIQVASALLMNITTLFHLGITEAAADFHTSVLSVCSTE